MDRIFYIIAVVVISVMAVIFLFPIYWTVSGSFQGFWEASKTPPNFYPKQATLFNYRWIFERHPCFRWIMNTLIIACGVTAISVTTSCLSGYAFAKKEFPGRNLLFWMLLATLMVPFHVTVIPLFITLRGLGLHNTYPGVILTLVLGTGFMFLARQYMSTIPSELIDAAKVDGASELRVFTSVILPISKPLVAALCIFSFVGSWITFFWPLVMTSSDKARTLAVGIVMISQGEAGLENVGIAMAGATIVSVPLYIIFLSFQKYFTKGITLGGVKG